ncbi:hypothetical protein HPB50_012290 [Hyalomma asiaticum]|uniref:Uncharacterized protein n=1 Tax=Hyalomma asiaticum TaxID=266040 RepID=A0ACB7S688_HYAAI|nr:hypothetical protein HPB50_012290 [Hyalomma asiaticum]
MAAYPPYYDNTAFQEGVGDASFYDYNVNVGPYDVQGQWDGSNGGSTTETDEGNLTATTELELKVPTMIRQMLTTPP